MNYSRALEKIQKEAAPATGMTRAELEAAITSITTQLIGPMSNVERILLCGDRSSLRKALANLDATP